MKEVNCDVVVEGCYSRLVKGLRKGWLVFIRSFPREKGGGGGLKMGRETETDKERQKTEKRES